MNWVSIIVSIVTAGVTGGVVTTLLLLRPTKKKIDAEANEKQASTTDILTGAALRMVTAAQDQAIAAQADAIAAREEATSARKRAEAAEERAIRAEKAAVACATEAANLTRQLDRYREYVISKGLVPID